MTLIFVDFLVYIFSKFGPDFWQLHAKFLSDTIKWLFLYSEAEIQICKISW